MTTSPTTTERGYGYDHQQERERWRPLVERGETHCHATTCLEKTRWIPPGSEWHLGHTEDRTDWTGPEHARCNTSDGARRGNARRGVIDQPAAARPRPKHPAGW